MATTHHPKNAPGVAEESTGVGKITSWGRGVTALPAAAKSQKQLGCPSVSKMEYYAASKRNETATQHG